MQGTQRLGVCGGALAQGLAVPIQMSPCAFSVQDFTFILNMREPKQNVLLHSLKATGWVTNTGERVGAGKCCTVLILLPSPRSVTRGRHGPGLEGLAPQ